MDTIVYGNKMNTVKSLNKLFNEETYIKNDKNNFLNIIKSESYIFTYDIDKIYDEFKTKNINNKNNILIHFVGKYMLSDVTNLVNKFIEYNNDYNIEFTISEGEDNFVSLYVS